MDRDELESKTDAALGEDATYAKFRDERAAATIDRLRNGLTRTTPPRFAERWTRLIETLRKKSLEN